MKTNANHTRRGFFKTAGIVSAVAAYSAWSPRTGTAKAEDGAASDGLPFQLGLASYTTRKFTLEETVAMAKRVGLTHLCLKSFHLPLDATDEQIVAAAKTVKDAGLDLYGGGVISMKKPEDVEQAFAYAKAAGMRTIVGVPAPEVLPLVNEKVKQFDIEVAIHNHGPGDKVYPTPRISLRENQGSGWSDWPVHGHRPHVADRG